MKLLRRIAALLCAGAMVLGLTGCAAGVSLEDLFALPQIPAEYQALQAQLDQLTAAGYEYITPDNGPYLEAVQMVDLDGDGEKEAMVCMRRSTDTQPLKVIVFTQVGGQFSQLCAIEGEGESIDAIHYQDLTGDGDEEIIVGWHKGNSLKEVSVYRVGRECLPLVSTEYTHFSVEPLGWETPSLLVLSGTSTVTASCYDWDTDLMRLTSKCTLRSTMEDIGRGSILGGYLDGRKEAVYITGVTVNGKAVTDVLSRSGDALRNLSVQVSSYSDSGLAPRDINGDGAVEVPVRITDDPDTPLAANADTFVSWQQCDEFGFWFEMMQTYHCRRYSWYMTVPGELKGRISAEAWNSADGEYRVLFSVDGEPAAAIYTITGENRESRAGMAERFIITRLPATIYAGELYSGAQSAGVNEETLREHFSLAVSTWDSK